MCSSDLLIPRPNMADGPGSMSPREIQTRIRAGADVHALAAESGTSLERIMAFAVPILQERSHIATRARATLVRRAAGVGALEDIVTARLQPLGVTSLDTEWDARRLDDGRWEVHLSYPTKEGPRVATWLFDAKSSVLSPLDDEAHWLLGEPVGSPAPVTEHATHQTRPTLPMFRKVEGDNVVPMKRREERAEDDDGEPTRKSPGRKPVPSWDEILFGSPTDEN